MRPVLFQIGNVKLYSYGLMLYLAGFSAVYIAMIRGRKKGLDAKFIPNLGIYSIIVGILGAKVLYFFTVIPDMKEDFLGTLKSSLTSGFVVYGGVIAGLIFAYLYCRKNGKHILSYLDLAAPSIAFGQAVGRLGCFLAGCCYGHKTDAWYGVVFPAGGSAPAGVKLFPSQLLSLGLDLINFAILCAFDRKNEKCGRTLSLYMITYSIGRFLVEYTRNDYRGSVMSLSTSQFISIFVLAGGVLLWIFFTRKAIKAPAESHDPLKDTAEAEAAAESVAD